jgi:chloramphenicol O-acetyltransferase type B
MTNLVRRLLRRLAREPSLSMPSLREQFPMYAIGRHTYGPLRVRDDGDGSTLSIGSFTSIAEGVSVFTGGEHRPDWVTTYPFNVLWDSARHHTGHPHSKGDVHIGNDVWLGAECLILSGVTVGDGAVVGARAVVRQDVPPYAVVVGSPARVVKKRFDDEQIAALLRIRWWNWSDAEIDLAMPYLLAPDIDSFIRRAATGEIGPA